MTQPAWTIAYSMWQAHRRGYVSLLAATLLSAVILYWVGPGLHDPEALNAVGYLPMGLLLFITFVFCGFTETDARGRFTGYPARLFTLPVPTTTLIAAPMLFSIVTVGVIYALWAKLVLPIIDRGLPLAWPALYLATGMICYQAIVWSMARWRFARLLTLGVGGTLFAFSWTAFRNDFERELLGWLIPASLPVRPVLCGAFISLSCIVSLISYTSVESQRRGGSTDGQLWRRFTDWVTDLFPSQVRPLTSPASAQFWFEWRRHGFLLPLCTLGVLALVMLPGLFLEEPISRETTMATLAWILILPLLIAFTLGQGFGKADLWSKEPGISLFHASRPISNPGWIAAKMKTAALASLLSWLLVLILTPLWICYSCDWQSLTELWWNAERLYPARVLYALPVLVFGSLILLTWRIFLGNLYIGLSGRNWLLTTAACTVFVVIIGTPFAVVGFTQHPEAMRRWLRVPVWLPWLLAGLFIVKVSLAASLTLSADRRGYVTQPSVARYLIVWSGGTGFLVLSMWLLIPVQGWLRWTSALVMLFAMPLVRMVYAPIALAHNRQR